MGIYYRGISKRYKTVDGTNILFTNFWGKAPGLFCQNTGRWNAFLTRSENTALDLRESNYTYVMNVKDNAELAECGEASVAVYSGQATMTDGFWDNNIVGKVKKVGGRWKLVINQRLVAAREARIAERNTITA